MDFKTLFDEALTPKEPEPNHWYKTDEGFRLIGKLTNLWLEMVVQHIDGKGLKSVWQFKLYTNSNNYSGTITGIRDTQEEAFKAADQLLYHMDKDTWMKVVPGPVLEPWKSTLPEVSEGKTETKVNQEETKK